MADSERRRYPRIPLDGRMVGRATLLADFRIVALSETGATLSMGVPMSLGSTCELTLNLSHVSIDLTGRVVNRRDDDAVEGPYLVGVDFENIDEIEAGLLQSFLERERRRVP